MRRWEAKQIRTPLKIHGWIVLAVSGFAFAWQQQLEHNRWVNHLDSYEARTPLMLASLHGGTKIVEVLLQRCRDTIELNKVGDYNTAR